MINKLIRLKMILYWHLKNQFCKNIELKPRLFIQGKFNSLKIEKLGKLKILGMLTTRQYVSINISEGELILSNGVFVNSYSSFNVRKKIIIGEDTLIGEGVRFYDHDHVYNANNLIKDSGFITKPILVGKNVWIGSNAVILKGVDIGDNCVIAANAVVNVSIPPNSLYISKNNIRPIVRTL